MARQLQNRVTSLARDHEYLMSKQRGTRAVDLMDPDMLAIEAPHKLL